MLQNVPAWPPRLPLQLALLVGMGRGRCFARVSADKTTRCPHLTAAHAHIYTHAPAASATVAARPTAAAMHRDIICLAAAEAGPVCRAHMQLHMHMPVINVEGTRAISGGSERPGWPCGRMLALLYWIRMICDDLRHSA